jgi:hypothetical protein
LRPCGAESSSIHVFDWPEPTPYLAGRTEKFQETFLCIFCSIFMMKKCNSASKKEGFVIIPEQFPWSRWPRSRNGFIGTSDMPKAQRLEHGERRRCLVAPRRASCRQTRYSVSGRRRVLPVEGGPKPWQGPDGVHGDIVAPDTAVSGMITCGTGSPLADGSGAKALGRGRELGSDLARRGGLNRT